MNIIERSGFLIVGIEGLAISPSQRKLLEHEAIAGVILYGKNYSHKAQLSELIADLHSIKPGFIVSADQECQRVQVFQKDFSKLPMPRDIGKYYEKDEEEALNVAYAYGVIVGSEMREVGIDLSYLPVLDMAHFGGVIGRRAFHSDPEVVVALARSLITGLHNSSLSACAKHFPGHGSVSGDTHRTMIYDPRPWDEIEKHDLYPFSKLIEGDYLEVIMLSHVVYTAVCDTPASLSDYWLKTVLRERLKFNGLICSDDLDMVGSGQADADALKRAMEAGCDALLICQRNEDALWKLIAAFSDAEINQYSRAAAMHLPAIDTHLVNRIPCSSKHYKEARKKVNTFNKRISKKL